MPPPYQTITWLSRYRLRARTFLHTRCLRAAARVRWRMAVRACPSILSRD